MRGGVIYAIHIYKENSVSEYEFSGVTCKAKSPEQSLGERSHFILRKIRRVAVRGSKVRVRGTSGAFTKIKGRPEPNPHFSDIHKARGSYGRNPFLGLKKEGFNKHRRTLVQFARKKER